MRKLLFGFCTLLFLNLIFAQHKDSGIYYPLEQIGIADCDQAGDKNKCITEVLGNALRKVVNTELRKSEIRVDTLRISIGFSLDKKGRLDKFPVYIQIDSGTPRNDLYSAVNDFIIRLPRFDVSNRKPKGYRSLHEFEFLFPIDKDDFPPVVTSVISEKEYHGGVIVEIPEFPGCENLTYQETADCFTKKMQQHIALNFKYPDEALKNKIQGKVFVLFTINEKGTIENIRTREGVGILQAEAVRIVELLPPFKPALKDGLPTRIPFTIPITFKLE